MINLLSQADQDICAREATAAIEAVLDQRYPDVKSAFWTAVDKLYRLNVSPGEPPEASLLSRSKAQSPE